MLFDYFRPLLCKKCVKSGKNVLKSGKNVFGGVRRKSHPPSLCLTPQNVFATFQNVFATFRTFFAKKKVKVTQITCKIVCKWCICYLSFENTLKYSIWKTLTQEDMTHHNINSDTNSWRGTSHVWTKSYSCQTIDKTYVMNRQFSSCSGPKIGATGINELIMKVANYALVKAANNKWLHVQTFVRTPTLDVQRKLVYILGTEHL